MRSRVDICCRSLRKVWLPCSALERDTHGEALSSEFTCKAYTDKLRKGYFIMLLDVHPKTKTIHVTDDTRQYLEKKMGKLGKHFRREPEAQATQGFERGLHIVEVT